MSDSTVKWFGRGRPPGPDGDEIPVPVGEPCMWCHELIAAWDNGITMPTIGPGHTRTDPPWHQECFTRSIVGSVAHLEGRCSCVGGTDDDPPNMTKHEAAWAACVTAIRLGKLPALWRRQG